MPPAPSATVSEPATAEEALIIEEPLPEEPAEVVPQEPATPQPPARRPRPSRTEPSAPAEPQASALEAASPEVPTLEPRESLEYHAALRSRIIRLQTNLDRRIGALSSQRLTSAARRTLEDARTFLSQSKRATDDGDLQRALNLAQKAELLVSALEQ